MITVNLTTQPHNHNRKQYIAFCEVTRSITSCTLIFFRMQLTSHTITVRQIGYPLFYKYYYLPPYSPNKFSLNKLNYLIHLPILLYTL